MWTCSQRHALHLPEALVQGAVLDVDDLSITVVQERDVPLRRFPDPVPLQRALRDAPRGEELLRPLGERPEMRCVGPLCHLGLPFSTHADQASLRSSCSFAYAQ